MSRSVALWVGSTDDAAIPPRVRARVFERCAGRCHRCNRKIGPADSWIIEHLIALINGGRHSAGFQKPPPQRRASSPIVRKSERQPHRSR